ncbi:MAG: ATP-binding protein [Bacteroidia bacterium]
MIVEFSVKNFRSINELQTISFVATGLTSHKDNINLDTDNIANEGGMDLLKTIGIYGANASGKSNIIKALNYFINIIATKIESDTDLIKVCDPFLYQENVDETESFFQIVLFIDNKKYRYGFTVKEHPVNSINSVDFIFTNEWLFGPHGKNNVELFTRKGTKFKLHKSLNENKIPFLPSKYSLLLSHIAAFEPKSVCALIRNFFSRKCISNINNELDLFMRNTLVVVENKEDSIKQRVLDMLSVFNLNYTDIVISRDGKAKNSLVLPLNKITLIKEIEINGIIERFELNLDYQESTGTQKLFQLAGALLSTFNFPSSALVIIDEIDSNFHPALLIKLIGLFNDPKINKSNSQLLFTSHDTNLMSPKVMRRDQFYFAEKQQDHSTRFFALSDLKGIRNDADFAKQYLAGFYGALPVLSEYENTITESNEGSLGR